MTRRILTVILALVLALGCFSFAVADEEYEPLTATAVVYGSSGFVPTNDNYGTKLIKELFNLELDVLPVDGWSTETWSTFWLDGYADIIIPAGKAEILLVKESDLLRTFPYEWLEQYAPNIYTLLEMMYGTPEAIKEQATFGGDMYCIPYFAMTNCISWVTGFRNDWLKNVNLEMPTTMEELEAILHAFTFGDPDGNGVDDTFAMDGIQYGMFNIGAYYGTSDVFQLLRQDDGTVTTNAISEEYKTLLTKLAEWYAAGYIDPEFVTDDRAAIRSKFASGKLGIYADNPWWFEKGRGDVGPLNMLCASDPSVDFATALSFMTSLPNADGEIYVNSLFGDIKGQAAVYFGYDCPDEVVIRMLQIQNRRAILFDGSEEDIANMKLRATMDSGIEGEDWYYDEATNSIVATEERQNNPRSAQEITDLGLYIFPCAQNQNLDGFIGQEDEFVIGLYEMSMNPNKIYRSNNFAAPTLSDEGADRSDLINEYFKTFKNEIITGKKTIEADWDNYVAEMERLGLQDLLDEYASLL